MLEDADLSCSVLDAQALEEAKVDFRQSLATCPEVPQKRHSLLSRWHCRSWGISLPSFLRFEERSGVDFFGSEEEPLPWVEPELSFCLDLDLPDLLSNLAELDLLSDLFPEEPEARVSRESSPFHSQYRASIAWTSLWSPARVFGLSWWTISSLICLANPL